VKNTLAYFDRGSVTKVRVLWDCSLVGISAFFLLSLSAVILVKESRFCLQFNSNKMILFFRRMNFSTQQPRCLVISRLAGRAGRQTVQTGRQGRQTDRAGRQGRQADRAGRQTGQADRQGRQTGQADRAGRQTGQADRAGRQTGQAGRLADWQTGRLADKQTGRQGRQADKADD
jgi:hypothetical protein